MRFLAANPPTDVPGVFGTVTPPNELGQLNSAPSGAAAISIVLTNIVSLIYVIAAIICVFMIIFGAVGWITSGGEKEAVAKARARITWAIIGVVVLAVTFLLLHILGSILNINFFSLRSAPCTTPSVYGENPCP